MPHAAGEDDDEHHPSRQRNHKFETFTQRVARLKIDPIRRNRNRDQELEGDGLQSYFRTGLDRWRELNLSESFSSFVKEVESLCDNLPQILHHKSQIVAILLRYLDERNALSLESLFDLTSCLAHDLGLNFEDHFHDVLALVLDIAAKHKDIEVIEWSFSSLAWLFKYLARLLVPDLRPTYDLMARALGKDTSKPHIARFAAEALSFLVRKAASTYSKDPVPLQKIVPHIYADVESFDSDKHNDIYCYGVMTLFATTIKGLNTELHSVAPAVYQCLLVNALAKKSQHILLGITTSCIHHTNEDTTEPLRQIIFDYADRLSHESSQDEIGLFLTLMESLASVRHGTRVGDWQSFMSKLSNTVDLMAPTFEGKIRSQMARTTAIAFSLAPLQACISQSRLISLLLSRLGQTVFLELCLYEAELSRDRFTRFFLPTPTFLQVIARIPENMDDVFLLATLRISAALSGSNKSLDLSIGFQKQVSEIISAGLLGADNLALVSSCLDLVMNSHMDDSVKADIGESLLDNFDTIVVDPNCDQQEVLQFHLTTGLRFLLEYSENKLSWNSVIRHLATFAGTPLYLENVRKYLSLLKREVILATIPVLTEEIIGNLSSASKELRQSSLLLLQDIHVLETSQASVTLSTALELENLSLDIKTARAASMLVRRLAEQYPAVEETSWLAKAIPTYCFGLLHFKLSQVWSESIDGLKQMSSRSSAETAITNTVFQWLDLPKQEQAVEERPSTGIAAKYNEFQCSARARTLGHLERLESELKDAKQQIKLRFKQAQTVEPHVNNYNRGQALRVLKALPGLAEKKSRQLVPIFLRYSHQPRDVGLSELAEHDQDVVEENALATKTEQTLSRQEQLGMLEVFGQFTNPRMLYKTSEVHDGLFHYLSSGDGKLQTAALKALATWKSPVLDKYLENLNNLLDEKRFREELSTFLAKENELVDIDFHEILPVLLRVLYGRAISRTGSTSSKGSLMSKRKAIFDAIARLGPTAIQQFVKIALGPLSNLMHQEKTVVTPGEIEVLGFSLRQQLGLLNLLQEMIDTLGDKIEPALHFAIPAILSCGRQTLELDNSSTSTAAKEIRKVAIQCLTSISLRASRTLTPSFAAQIIQIFVTPRLENLASENSQSVSALLQLLGAWATSPDTALWLVTGNSKVLEAVTQILMAPAVKESAVLYVMDQILKPLARMARSDTEPNGYQIRKSVLGPNIEYILERLGLLLNNNPEKRILASALSLLSELADSVDGFSDIQALLRLAALLLTEPSNRVSSQSKNDILGFLARFISLSGLSAGDKLLQKLEASLSPLMLHLRGRDSRIRCGQVLLAVATLDSNLQQVASICSDLDAFSSTTIDEPDFNRRIGAFRILEHEGQRFSARQWQPILYSLLYHIQDTQELAIRTSASKSLKDFVKIAAAMIDQQPEFFNLLDSILVPNLRKGVTQPSELVRLEYLSVFAEVVRCCPSWDKVNDLRSLLVNDDEEASFFNNILHIQQHRRLRALRRLAGEATKGQLQSANIAHFLIPLLEHFVLDQPEDKPEHNIIYETITTLGALSLGLEWPQFRAMYRRYTSYILTNPNLEKAAVRLLTMMTDSLSRVTANNEKMIDPDLMDQDNDTILQPSRRLLETLPKGNKFSEDIANNLTTPLRQYVHHKDETLVSQRVPVSVTVAKLIMLLNEDQIVQQLPPLLTDVCQILRSRAQESRDLSRKTLVEISQAVGPTYFGFILKELRTALPRGYQLHVLSFSAHALLVANEQACQNGELDYCLPDIANIIMDDTFGVTGQEKDAEEYISQMREVKSNKSYDSTEIMARISGLSHINKLLRPIIALLEEHIDLRMLKKVDELLRRFGIGLLRNTAIGSQEALVLCFELLQQVFKKTKISSTPKSQDPRTRRFLIAAKSLKSTNVTHGTASAVHKMGRFGLDLLRMVLSRHTDLQTPANLVGFLPIIGEAIMSNHEEVQVAVIRLIATIIRVPLEQLDKNAPVYVSEAMALIKNATSTSSESAQAALKLVTVLLRDRDNANIKQVDVAYILNRIKADIDEPDRQGIIFNFLKAVLYRRVIVAEVYDVMDSMAALMIQNQSASSRDAARGVYVQFLVNYPQGKDRLKKQWDFLIENLSYEFAEGRQSVMETMHLLLGKVGVKVVQDIVTTFYAPVVLATVNDESAECRKMAALLLQEFFEHSNDETESKLTKVLRSWLTQEESTLLLRTSLQIFIIYVEAHPTKARREVPSLISRITQILESIDYQDALAEWENAYFSLQLIFKLVQTYPEELLSKDTSDLWTSVFACSRFPHAWVKTAAAKALGLYFADFARTNATTESPQLPLLGSGGLSLDQATIVRILRDSLGALKAPMISEEMAKQLVKNIVFLGRLIGAIPIGSFDAHDTIVISEQSAASDGEDTDDDSNDDGESNGKIPNNHHAHPLALLFARVSSILRREPTSTKAAAMVPKTSAIHILAALCTNLSGSSLLPHAFSILLPLYLLTDPSTTTPFSTDEGFKTATTEVASNAQELMSLLQTKLGTSAFVEAVSKVREAVKQKREARRVKRRIDTVSAPEIAGLKRMKKRSQQREQKKQKNASYRAQRRGW